MITGYVFKDEPVAGQSCLYIPDSVDLGAVEITLQHNKEGNTDMVEPLDVTFIRNPTFERAISGKASGEGVVLKEIDLSQGVLDAVLAKKAFDERLFLAQPELLDILHFEK